jgi:type II secretion system protein H
MSGGMGMVLLENHKGVTLIELMIVLAITAVLAGMTGFGLRTTFVHYHLDAAARQLASDLRWAHQSAVSQRTPMEVALDPPSERYHVARTGTGEVVAARELKRVDLVGYTGLTESNCSGGKVVFDEDGTTSCWTTITLETATGEKRLLSVIATGRVRITKEGGS